MYILRTITGNSIINVCVVSWISAQLIKTLLVFAMTKRLNWERMFGAGGMPSSHSALVTSLALSISRKVGFASIEFALAFVLAAVVMYDAMGVRRAAGEQAKILNKVVIHMREEGGASGDVAFGGGKKRFRIRKGSESEKLLKEFLGHTPLEVLGGALLGIVVAMVMPVA